MNDSSKWTNSRSDRCEPIGSIALLFQEARLNLQPSLDSVLEAMDFKRATNSEQLCCVRSRALGFCCLLRLAS